MTWYYALGNERQGPIDDTALDRLVATGVVTPDTLVWKAGPEEPEVYGTFRDPDGNLVGLMEERR